MGITKSLFYFFLAGLYEIGGGYLVWLWLRESKSIWFGLLRVVVLIFMGLSQRFNRLTLEGFMQLMVVFSLFFLFYGDG